jgi:hypothetical protein
MADDGITSWIGRFEDADDDGRNRWLGGGVGLLLGVGLVLLVLGTAPTIWIAVAETGSRLLGRLLSAVWAILGMFTIAYWHRQRLVAHFEAAHRRLGSADPGERQRGLVDLMVNSRRGRAEHRRIARDLSNYLRGAPLEAPDEAGRRQFAFTMLADQTLALVAKQGIDLSGAMLAGIRGVNAELPGVRLCGADLSGARLARANLEGADLRGARLDDADLSGARLAGALLPPPAAPALHAVVDA